VTGNASRLLVHVGCGPRNLEALPGRYRDPTWRELRVDLDPGVEPDLVASATDLAGLAKDSADALWTGHTLEHLPAHDVSRALVEFFRVLRPGGELGVEVPDLQRVAELVAADRLEEAAYLSSSGPIAALDMIYGHRGAVAAGNEFMAHRTGFTARSLAEHLRRAGYEAVEVRREGFNLTASARKPARPAADETPEYTAAVAFHQQGQLDCAIARYRAVLERQPGHAEARANLGAALRAAAQLPEAVACLRQATELMPESAEVWYNLGNALQAAADLPGAADAFARAVGLRGDLAPVHFNLGNVLRDLGRLGEAVASYERALAVRPDLAVAHTNLGNLLKALGRREEAVAHHREAVRLAPAAASAHYNLGNALQALGRPADAAEAFRQAVALDPTFAPAHQKLAMVTQVQGEGVAKENEDITRERLDS
jgi:tetratricopeptide (TPR) repeat protein